MAKTALKSIPKTKTQQEELVDLVHKALNQQKKVWGQWSTIARRLYEIHEHDPKEFKQCVDAIYHSIQDASEWNVVRTALNNVWRKDYNLKLDYDEVSRTERKIEVKGLVEAVRKDKEQGGEIPCPDDDPLMATVAEVEKQYHMEAILKRANEEGLSHSLVEGIMKWKVADDNLKALVVVDNTIDVPSDQCVTYNSSLDASLELNTNFKSYSKKDQALLFELVNMMFIRNIRVMMALRRHAPKKVVNTSPWIQPAYQLARAFVEEFDS